MMNRSTSAIALLLSLFLLLSLVQGKVLDLTEKTFNKQILDETNTLAIVMFKASWCGHCQRFAPEFNKAEKEFANFYKPAEEGDAVVKFAVIECPDNQSLCSRYGVQGYPTVKFFGGGKVEDFQGGRDKDSVVTFMKNKLSTVKPAPKPVELKTQKQLDQCLKSTVCVYAVLPDENNSTKKERDEYIDILTKAAKKNKNFDIKWVFSYARTHKKFDQVLQLGQNGYPAITLMNQRKKIQSPMYRAFTTENIADWAGKAGAGRVAQAIPLKELPTIGHDEL